MSDVQYLWCLRRRRLLAVGAPSLVEPLAEAHRARSGPCAVTSTGTPPWQQRHLTLISSQPASSAAVFAAACVPRAQTSERLADGERVPHVLPSAADLREIR